MEEELELEVIEKDQGEKPEADCKTMLFPKANEWFAGKRCLEREEIRRITKFREGSVPSLAEVAFHLVGLSLFSRDYAWFVFYLQAILEVGTAEQRESSLALEPLYANISCLEKKSQRPTFLIKLELH